MRILQESKCVVLVLCECTRASVFSFFLSSFAVEYFEHTGICAGAEQQIVCVPAELWVWNSTLLGFVGLAGDSFGIGVADSERITGFYWTRSAFLALSSQASKNGTAATTITVGAIVALGKCAPRSPVVQFLQG